MLEVTAYTGIGPGVHQVAVTGLEVKPAKAGGTYLRWEFTDQNGKTASDNSSVEMTPGNKTGKRYAILTGRPTVVGEQRALAEVIGKRCTIVLEINPEGYPKVIALTEPQGAVPSHPPVGQTVAQSEVTADSAARQHAIQEGDDALPF